jgi:hypothetical protein
MATLRFAADTSKLDGSVFSPRAWAGSDSDAITFAIARRAARASGMLLRLPQDHEPAVRLEIPLEPEE